MWESDVTRGGIELARVESPGLYAGGIRGFT